MLRGLFRTKNLDDILAALGDETHALKRSLGAFNVTLLGIGAIIGAGIFATVGTAAAGDASRPGAGPSLMLSFCITAIVCAFTALCYAEMAAMVPISGSAYTYSYATLGELVAWIIGWDLILEYAIGNVAVAISWANYFRSLMESIGITIPQWLSTDFRTAHKIPGLIESAPHILGVPIVFNLLAFGIVTLITIVLVWGIKESAQFNAVMVMIKILVLLFFIVISLYFVSPAQMTANWHPLSTEWLGRNTGRSCRRLLRLHRLRRCINSRRGNQESSQRSADRNHCVADYLHCVLCGRGSGIHRSDSLSRPRATISN